MVEVTVAISDAQFRLGVGVAGVACWSQVSPRSRFCGSVSLARRSRRRRAVRAGTQASSSSSRTHRRRSTRTISRRTRPRAGVRDTDLEEMARKLAVSRRRGAPGARGRTTCDRGRGRCGLRVRALRRRARARDRQHDDVRSRATSWSPSRRRTSAAAPPRRRCRSTRWCIAKGGSETRVECIWRDGMALAVTRVETVEVSPLLGLVPQPGSADDGRDRATGRARSPGCRASVERCSPVVSQAVRSGLEKGEIGWRDLVDFYARHRCQTYPFPCHIEHLRYGQRAAAAGRVQTACDDSAALDLLFGPRLV